jgi:hypothetical protein
MDEPPRLGVGDRRAVRGNALVAAEFGGVVAREGGRAARRGAVRRQGERGGIVAVPVGLRRHERQVRLVEAHREEEGPPTEFPQGRDGPVGDLHVGEGVHGPLHHHGRVVVGVVGRLVDRGVRVARRRRHPLLLRPGRHAPRGVVAMIAVGDVEDLAVAARLVAVVLEVLGQRDHVGVAVADELGQGEHAERLRPTPRQERRPRRIAERELAVGAFEAGRRGREGVDAGRLHGGVAVAAEHRPQVVDRDEQHVQPRLRRTAGRRPWAGEGDRRHNQADRCRSHAAGMLP